MHLCYNKAKRELCIKKRIAAVIFIFLVALNVFSLTKTEGALSGVDALIEEGRLDEALTIISAYIRKNPKDFDSAQQKIKKILKMRGDYIGLTEDLLRVIVDEPLNDEKKLFLIARLESREKALGEEELRFIRETKTAAQFTYYRAVFDGIMNDGARLLTQKHYSAAARRFADGFTIYQDDFFKDHQGTELGKEVKNKLQDVFNALNEYESMQNALSNAFERFNSDLRAYDIGSSLNSYKTLESLLKKYAAMRNVHMQTGTYFRDVFLGMQKKEPELTEASFLPFAYRLLLGRETNVNTGIVTAMDIQWDQLCSRSQSLLTAMIEKYTNDSAVDLVEKKPEQIAVLSDRTFNRLQRLVQVDEMGKSFTFLYDLLTESKVSGKTNAKTYIASLDYHKDLIGEAEHVFTESRSFVADKKRYEAVPVPQPSASVGKGSDSAYAQTVSAYGKKRLASLQSTEASAAKLRKTRDLFTVSFTDSKNRAVADLAAPPWENLYLALIGDFSAVSAENKAQTLAAWESLSSFYAGSSALVKEKYTKSYNDAVALINESLDRNTVSRPAEALAAFNTMKEGLASDINVLKTRFKLLSDAPSVPVQRNPGSDVYTLKVSSLSSDIAYLSDLQNKLVKSAETAQMRTLMAQQAKADADLKYEQAKAALKREDFTSGKRALERSRSKYNESLLYQDSPELRLRTDRKLDELGLEIVRRENEKVIRDVRRLITESRLQYYNGNFEQAEELVLQAESRWSTTNVDPNSELMNLKALIGNALSIHTGRVIAETDPLYPEMSQTLLIAHQYFDKGSKNLKKGSRSSALADLKTAREKIKDVQVLYPLNKEASLLTLRIDQLTDPNSFKINFAQRFNTARNEYINKKDIYKAYADLKDLYEINPAYPNLKKLVYDIEVDLGIVIPPPDEKKLKRSIQLVNEARYLYQTKARDEIALNDALSRLTEALSLNPENTDAMVLADRIKTTMGGQSLVVLTAEKEEMYQQAILELSKGNTITAAAIVGSLWQDPKLRRSAKIIDLKQKVDSLL